MEAAPASSSTSCSPNITSCASVARVRRFVLPEKWAPRVQASCPGTNDDVVSHETTYMVLETQLQPN